MNIRKDPIQDALNPLSNTQWENSGHQKDLESRLFEMHKKEMSAKQGWRSKPALLLMLVLLLGGIATATSPLWWEAFTVIVEDLGNGDSRYIILDENGKVDFDEVIRNGEGLLMTDENEYIIVEPETQVEVDQVLKEIENHEKENSK